jgi:glutathione reductase (NADPH)
MRMFLLFLKIGTCVNVGCVPKKLMFNAAQQREAMVGDVATAQGNGYNVPVEAGVFDWAGMKARRDAYVSKLNNSYLSNWKGAGIEVVIGVASFQDSKTVQVMQDDGSLIVLTAPHVLVAVGGEPADLDIPGKELAVNSDGFFDLETQPKKVAVIGAGYIAVEFAGIFHGLGSDTHLYFRGDTVLRRGFDPFIVDTLMSALEKHGPELHRRSCPVSFTRDASSGLLSVSSKIGDEDKVVTEDGFDAIVMAIGRRPTTDVLNLNTCGVNMNSDGFIEVDPYENTNVPGIYAIGDCTNTGYELTPVAIAAGRRLADRLFGGEPRARIEYFDIATVVFSHPPIGTVGLTEPDARKQFGDDQVAVKQVCIHAMYCHSTWPSFSYFFCLPCYHLKKFKKWQYRLASLVWDMPSMIQNTK